MGISLPAMNCDKCGVPMTDGVGPNSMRTSVDGVAIMIIFCPNPQCKKIFGTVNA